MSFRKQPEHLIMPFPLSIHAQEKHRACFGLVVLASSFLAAVALLAFLNEYSDPAIQIDALQLKDGFTVAQIGQYANPPNHHRLSLTCWLQVRHEGRPSGAQL